MNRRHFLKLALLTSAVTALPAAASPAKPNECNDWYENDSCGCAKYRAMVLQLRGRVIGRVLEWSPCYADRAFVRCEIWPEELGDHCAYQVLTGSQGPDLAFAEVVTHGTRVYWPKRYQGVRFSTQSLDVWMGEGDTVMKVSGEALFYNPHPPTLREGRVD